MIQEINYNTLTRSFSIQSGKYEGKKRTPMHGGKLKWGLITGGLVFLLGKFKGIDSSDALKAATISGLAAAFLKWMFNANDQASFNSALASGSAYKLIDKLDELIIGDQVDETTTTTRTGSDGSTTSRSRTVRGRQRKDLGNLAYSVDRNPAECDINIAYDGTHMIFLLNNLSDRRLKLLSNELDAVCHRFRLADYRSKMIKKGFYIVDFLTPSDSYWYIPYDLVQYGIKFNILTEFKG